MAYKLIVLLIYTFTSGHRRLGKVTTSYHQTRRRHDVLQKTSDLHRLEDIRFTTSWKRLIYVSWNRL